MKMCKFIAYPAVTILTGALVVASIVIYHAHENFIVKEK